MRSKDDPKDPAALGGIALVRASENMERDDTDLVSALHNRRRPRRIDDVSPELIPLLRGPSDTDVKDIKESVDESDDLSAARGVIWWVLLLVIVWGAIALLAWRLL
jgi:hypothetical protein